MPYELSPIRDSASTIPRSLAQTLTELPFGSQTQIRVRDGQLSAFLAYAGYDKRIGTAKYALRILNNTQFAAYGRLFVDAKGTQLDAFPKEIEVAPFSMRDDLIPIRMDVTGPFDRAIVAVSSEDKYFTVEAPPPPRSHPNWLKWAAVAAIPLVAGGAAQVYTPRILDVAAPQKALAGTTLQVPYQVAGIGSVEYDFRTRDGLQLAAGLTSQSGVLNLKIPRDGAGTPYTLRLRMRNAFFRAQDTTKIGAIVPVTLRAKTPVAPGSLIKNLSVTPSPVIAGKPISIHYAIEAQSGDLFMIDPSGATWAHAPLSLLGTTRLIVPKTAAGRDMRVVLHAQRGKEHAESSVGISVIPAAETVAQATSTFEPKPAPTPQVVPPTLTLSSQVVSPGDTVTASLSGTHGDVRITLMSSNGTTLAQGDADESNGVTLTAPNVTTPTTFYVVAALTNGVSQQSIVKRLTVTPR